MSAIIVLGATSVVALAASTQTVAASFTYQSALGAPIMRTSEGVGFYWPWSIIPWSLRWSEAFPRQFALAHLVLIAMGAAGMLAAAVVANGGAPRLRRHGPSGWASFQEAAEAGLFARQGAVLGKLDGEVLAYDGPGHLLLVGASRSGKGRGHVVPTLLAWGHSALVLDVKGELADGDPRHGFVGTAGFRESLGPVLRFAPTHPKSAHFNPLFEVRRGANEVRDGWSIDLSNMEGADPGGAAGLRDRVDNHLGRLATAVLLSSIMSVAANEAEDDEEANGFARSVGDAAAQEAARSGARIVERELQIAPTFRVRAGAPVRVLVMRDIALRPYDRRVR